jgi:hypothetical protein
MLLLDGWWHRPPICFRSLHASSRPGGGSAPDSYCYGVFALDNACPHTGGPLGEGLVQSNIVTYPLHGWQFDCTTGACLTEKGSARKAMP